MNGLDLIREVCSAVERGELTVEDAVARVTPEVLDACLVPAFERAARHAALEEGALLTRGVPAYGGAVSGRVVFSAQAAEARAELGEPLLLAREQLAPEEVGGLMLARGVITARGDSASHAAVMARAMKRPCVVGCAELSVDVAARRLRMGDRVVVEGDYLAIDGSSGEVFAASLPVQPSEVLEVLFERRITADQAPIYRCFERVMGWCDELARIRVRANADTPEGCRQARLFGAAGLGLCRTEQMFVAEDRLPIFQALILAEDLNACKGQLGRLLPLQREAFLRLFAEMPGKPVTIRMFDPPLHEFLPTPKALPQLADQMGVDESVLASRVDALREHNPMLGQRGCRLGITYPEITEMQARAIFEAALQVEGARPEILIPMVGHSQELAHQVGVIHRVAKAVFESAGRDVEYRVGAMIEVPRAALIANRLAGIASFFSFGTNDLTQMTLGLSRDDAGGILDSYMARGIYQRDPFLSLDNSGVGQLMELAIERGRATRPGMEFGLCGQQAADRASIGYCHSIGVDYVSCAPHLLPHARLAAAQAAL